jgi:hypothetical protein
MVVAVTALPTWAEKITPVDMDGAATLLGVSRRYLVDVLRDHPIYEPRGTRKVFYPEHIAQLREAICEQSREKANSSTSGQTQSPESTRSAGRLTESAYERALALAMKKKPTSSRHASKSGSGRVLPMVRKP